MTMIFPFSKIYILRPPEKAAGVMYLMTYLTFPPLTNSFLSLFTLSLTVTLPVHCDALLIFTHVGRNLFSRFKG